MPMNLEKKILEEPKFLYQYARKIDPSIALQLAMEAENEEERKFFAYIHNMNLQRAQKIAIERNLF